MAIVDTLRFLEEEHRTALSKYRGKPWLIKEVSRVDVKNVQPEAGPQIDQGWEIHDKVTGRHLITVYTAPDSHLLILPTVFMQQRSNLPNVEFPSLDDCAKAVWIEETSKRDQRTWKIMSGLVWFADLSSTLAKFFIKVGLAVLAIFAIVYAICRVLDEGTPGVVEALESLLPEQPETTD
ncbi:MAG: hypothetical protein OXQ90_07720 [Gammaproteobacteria bacterium]|nr:hypothetical protein [Gammaproteobacteria bacterium]